MKIAWSPTALNDLKSLREYIAADNPAAATATAEAFLSAAENLRQFPARGRAGRVPDTRELVIPGLSYIIVYTVEGDCLKIITVLHTSRRWPPPDSPS